MGKKTKIARLRLSHAGIFVALGLFSAMAQGADRNDPRSYGKQHGLSEWSELVADAWAGIFRSHAVLPDSVVVEVAPGKSPKVGVGLKMARPDFRGKLYVIEPTEESLHAIVAEYRKLFPKASVIGIPKLLNDVRRSDFPEAKISFVVANHPMDDFVAGKAIDRLSKEGRQQFQKIFKEMYNDPTESDKFIPPPIKKFWDLIGKTPGLGTSIRNEVVQEWEDLVQKLNPETLAIAQYPSRTLHTFGIFDPAANARYVMNDLGFRFPGTSNIDKQHLSGRGHLPEDWIITGLRGLSPDTDAAEIPEAVNRLGEAMFAKQVAHHLDPHSLELLAVNEDLAAHLFGDRARDPKWLRKAILENYAIDLEPGDNPVTGRVSTVHVDRQSDGPDETKDISMAGNKGSGRSAYLGKRINIKGPGRTVMVSETSKPGHRNGRVSTLIGLEEYVAQSAAATLGPENNSVLAVIDLNRTAHFDDFGMVPISLVVRVDGGSMDRPSHVFQNPEHDIDLLEMARRFGEGDAKRFLSRLIHGTWSSGNISMQGGILDTETASSVVGRGPLHTRARSFPANWFGLEGSGQKAVLRDLLKVSRRSSGVQAPDLEFAFDEARKSEMVRGFLHLQGLNASDIAAVLKQPSVKSQVEDLIARFDVLSRKIYPDYAALFPKTTDKSKLSVFDFSRLFREFSESYRNPKIDSVRLVREGFESLFNEKGSLVPVPPPKSLPDAIEPFVVKTQDELEKLKFEGRQFVTRFHQLFEAIDKEGFGIDKYERASRTFVINEDLPYLDIRPLRGMLERLLEKKKMGVISAERFRGTIELMREANTRVPTNVPGAPRKSNYRLFEEGHRFITDGWNEGKRLHIVIENPDVFLAPDAAIFINGKRVETFYGRRPDGTRSLVSHSLTPDLVKAITRSNRTAGHDVVTIGTEESRRPLTDLLFEPLPEHRVPGHAAARKNCGPELDRLTTGL